MPPEATLRKIAEGREAEIFAWEDGTVLRLLRNPNARQQVEWEAAAMRVAASAGVRVPAVHGTTTVDGRPGLVMERIDGIDLLTVLAQKPQQLFAIARLCAEIQARLHRANAPESMPPLRETFRNRIGSSSSVPRPFAEMALEALERLPDGETLCHGDFHPGNVIISNGEPVLIDWTGAMRGDATADFVRSLLLLRAGAPLPGTPRLQLALIKFGRRLFAARYSNWYGRSRSVDGTLASLWEVPVVANRLVDGLQEERDALLRMLEARAKA